MVKEILLNDRYIKINNYKEDKLNDLHKITVEFFVTSEDYQAVTALL